MGTAPALVLPYPVVRAAAKVQGSAAGRVRTFAADALWLLVLLAAIPFAIVAVGTPVALAVRLVLWIAKVL